MAVVGATIVLNATGPTALVTAAVTGSLGYPTVRNAGIRTVVVNTTAAAIYLGGSATGVTGVGTTGTMAKVTTFPITVPLAPNESMYGTVDSGNSNVGILITGG